MARTPWACRGYFRAWRGRGGGLLPFDEDGVLGILAKIPPPGVPLPRNPVPSFAFGAPDPADPLALFQDGSLGVPAPEAVHYLHAQTVSYRRLLVDSLVLKPSQMYVVLRMLTFPDGCHLQIYAGRWCVIC